MAELGTYGSVLGAAGNSCPYRDPMPDGLETTRLWSEEIA